MKTYYEGQLEIDHNSGVIYFYSQAGMAVLRICSLPKKVPNFRVTEEMLDITHMHGCNWSKSND